jgi:hypothetical protein
MPLAYKLLTVGEFLDSCPPDQRHYQLFDGVIVAMAPPAGRHQIIAAILTAEIVQAVGAHLPGCSVRSQAGIAPQGVRGRDHFETDVTVACEPLDERHRGIVINPLSIVEVLSLRPSAMMSLSSCPRISGSPACRKFSMSRANGSARPSIAAPQTDGRKRCYRRPTIDCSFRACASISNWDGFIAEFRVWCPRVG